MNLRPFVWAMAAAWPLAAWGQQNFDDVEIKAVHVAGAIHMLEGRGGNIGVSAGEDGILIIDDQFAPLAGKIREALKKLSQGGDGSVAFVLNTHWHGDHTGGNPHFGREAPIIAHANVRKRLSTRQESLGRTMEPLPKEGLPVITFDDTLSIHFNGEEIRLIHYPNSHTDGDSVIFFTGSKVVHTGDLFFSGKFPFVDLGSGGDVLGLTRSVEAVIGKLATDVKIIPGHGPLSTLDDLKAFHQMLKETTAWARERIAAGRSSQEMQQEKLPAKWESWGGGFISQERWIDILYQSLNRPQ